MFYHLLWSSDPNVWNYWFRTVLQVVHTTKSCYFKRNWTLNVAGTQTLVRLKPLCISPSLNKNLFYILYQLWHHPVWSKSRAKEYTQVSFSARKHLSSLGCKVNSSNVSRHLRFQFFSLCDLNAGWNKMRATDVTGTSWSLEELQEVLLRQGSDTRGEPLVPGSKSGLKRTVWGWWGEHNGLNSFNLLCLCAITLHQH